MAHRADHPRDTTMRKFIISAFTAAALLTALGVSSAVALLGQSQPTQHCDHLVDFVANSSCVAGTRLQR
jgi:hypothetical protein